MVFKISKSDGKIIYNMEFNDFIDITSYVQPWKADYIVACGHKKGAGTSNERPGYFKLLSGGDLVFSRQLTSIGTESTC